MPIKLRRKARAPVFRGTAPSAANSIAAPAPRGAAWAQRARTPHSPRSARADSPPRSGSWECRSPRTAPPAAPESPGSPPQPQTRTRSASTPRIQRVPCMRVWPCRSELRVLLHIARRVPAQPKPRQRQRQARRHRPPVRSRQPQNSAATQTPSEPISAAQSSADPSVRSRSPTRLSSARYIHTQQTPLYSHATNNLQPATSDLPQHLHRRRRHLFHPDPQHPLLHLARPLVAGRARRIAQHPRTSSIRPIARRVGRPKDCHSRPLQRSRQVQRPGVAPHHYRRPPRQRDQLPHRAGHARANPSLASTTRSASLGPPGGHSPPTARRPVPTPPPRGQIAPLARSSRPSPARRDHAEPLVSHRLRSPPLVHLIHRQHHPRQSQPLADRRAQQLASLLHHMRRVHIQLLPIQPARNALPRPRRPRE